MNLNTPLKLPPFNWEKILFSCVAALGALLLLGIITRARAILIAFDLVLLSTLSLLLVAAAYAIVRRYGPKK